ncbi:hypothetical protein BDW62DRAFT_217618 [Aspergillus aurantiobrunneus]
MTIAIAGSGDLTRYLTAEFAAANIPTVLLTRRQKPHFSHPSITQEVVDYTSTASLTTALDKHNATALISTILTYDAAAFITAHTNLIAAATASTSCKRFIPSEYGVNIQDYPDQPGFYYDTREPIRAMLRAQRELEWTLVCCGWVVDYIVPRANRYMKDIGDAFPANLAERRMVVPGTGRERVDFIAARDLARGLARLVSLARGVWEEYVYLSGEQMSCDELGERVRRKYEGGFEVRYLSLRELVNAVREARGEEERIEAEYKIVIPSGAAALDAAKVERHRGLYFQGIKFRGVQEVLDAVGEGVIV